MARVEGTRRMIRAGKTLVGIGLGSLLLFVVLLLIGPWIPLTPNVPWHAISVVHDLFPIVAIMALTLGSGLWFGGWVIAGFLD